MAGLAGINPEPTITAADVARGVCRLFAQAGLAAIHEVPLPNGRRTDLTAIDAKGLNTIVEIKVSRADQIGKAPYELQALMRTRYAGSWVKEQNEKGGGPATTHANK